MCTEMLFQSWKILLLVSPRDSLEEISPPGTVFVSGNKVNLEIKEKFVIFSCTKTHFIVENTVLEGVPSRFNKNLMWDIK